ncbi:MAG TPA: hypothetical protein VMW24_26490 [Sedimentisphaerales bacterium]|nr:hypothetical protein [Sedimentisphaerales bacterium]
MSTRQPANIPAALSAARRQFDRWRSRQPNQRARLPEALWQNAVALARKHGLNKTARALGLKYESLKKHLAATATGPSKPSQGRWEFLELLPSPVTSPSIDCTIELEEGDGTMMRMHVKGACMADLASFARGFRGGRG